MAISKRSKVVSLTKTSKKGRELKEKIIHQIQQTASKYNFIWLFKVDNMRNVLFKQVRSEFADSKFFFGRTKVMAKALGNSENEEILEGLHKLSENLVGDVGLFFTNESKERVFEFMASFEVLDFARTGCVAPESVVVYADEKGLKHAETEQFLPATAEPQLRGCGLPTMLVGGLIRLTCDSFQICEEGEKLNADKCRLLKMLGFRLAPFKIIPIGYYTEGNYISCSE